MSDGPLGLFVTWTVYGTFLPGDERGWKHRERGLVLSQPRLEIWHRENLNHDVVLLDNSMRPIVESAIAEICDFRDWELWANAVRSNHVHVVVGANSYDPKLVRDQIKAKATTELRKEIDIWVDRPVWTAKGDIEFLDSEDEISQCVTYCNEAQDRKDRDQLT